MNTVAVGLAVTPTVLTTFINHYLDRSSLHSRPTAHLPYNEGLHLIRAFLDYASNHTVDDLQAFTAQAVPYPQWVNVEKVVISESHLAKAAEILQTQLGNEGIKLVGGSKWWQWRNDVPLSAEWIEMRDDYKRRQQSAGQSRRVILYVHGGAYYFGSIEEHRYQLQRHARKLNARVFAPEYRLAPQFPFPCGLHDCLAAYLMLLDSQPPETILLAGDSAGGGMVMSMLVAIRDSGIPMPAGGILISPWVDLTHSFPSLVTPSPFDYIPEWGFHHKPSLAWPPPTDKQMAEIRSKLPLSTDSATSCEASPALTVRIGDEEVTLEEQIQMYAPNHMLSHPLISPLFQVTLGGLPPLMVLVGGGEILRDEQIYVAHKCANPRKYARPNLNEAEKAMLDSYGPTFVSLQVWEDLCHVAPTLSFTRPANFMYRAIAQFGAWALARAQKTGIEIIEANSSDSCTEEEEEEDRLSPEKSLSHEMPTTGGLLTNQFQHVGKAGDPLPPFHNHMIRHRVSRHGKMFSMEPESEIPALNLDPHTIGIVKVGLITKWLKKRETYHSRYASLDKKIHRQRLAEAAHGFHSYGPGENPPPSALAGRRPIEGHCSEGSWKKRKGLGLSIWSGWGSKHDQTRLQENTALEKPDPSATVPFRLQLTGEETLMPGSAVNQVTREHQECCSPTKGFTRPHTIVVYDNHQAGDADQMATLKNPKGTKEVQGVRGATAAGAALAVEGITTAPSTVAPVAAEVASGEASTPSHVTLPVPQVCVHESESKSNDVEAATQQNVEPQIDMGASGKRPHVAGVAMPFTLNREPTTASMITLQSQALSHADGGNVTPAGRQALSRDISDYSFRNLDGTASRASPSHDLDATKNRRPYFDGVAMPFSIKNLNRDNASMLTLDSALPDLRPVSSKVDQ